MVTESHSMEKLMSAKIHLQPFLSRGEAFFGPDGKVYLVPIQLFQKRDGGIILRIGENTLWFNPDGSYDGPEARLRGESAAVEYAAVLEAHTENKNQAPDEPYFQEGSNGWVDETKSWPAPKVTQ